jgi:hypothetical protein
MIEIHGYAIVSREDRIADANGVMPAALHNEADWAHFQAGLDRADWIALGRLTHEASPETKRRRRIILSLGAAGLESRADGWWWNPSLVSWADVAATLLPRGGCVAVPGGHAAFDCFLAIGYSAFHLSRIESLSLPRGRPLFSLTERGLSASLILAEAGLVAGEMTVLDAEAGVTLTIWRP